MSRPRALSNGLLVVKPLLVFLEEICKHLAARAHAAAIIAKRVQK